jgi:hypothetical protein
MGGKAVKVTTISANLRFSKDIGHGAWQVIEIGAEVSIDPGENWQTAQSVLYQQLGQQMTVLWNNGTGKPAQEPPTPETPAPKREHWCEVHQSDYKKFEKEGKVWFSHKTTEGKWCREG